jgi:type IV secretion system protein VirB9
MKLAAPFLIALLASGSPIWAADAPTDPRIHLLEFKPQQVNNIFVQRGVVTRVMLEQDEQIVIPVVGLSSDCNVPTDEWCISAIPGSNQFFVRPRDNAVTNNMELNTNKRDYSLVFKVVDPSLSHGKRGEPKTPFFRVVFQYPKPRPEATALSPTERTAVVSGLLRRVDALENQPLPNVVPPNHGMSPTQQLAAEGVEIRNTDYTKQVLPLGEDADPTMVFDDGRFTYFEFPGAREIPAIFAHGSEGEPTRVNWHMNGSFVVVQRLARKFTIRLGGAVVGVFNEAYDPTGIETPTATVSPSVSRAIKGEAQ